MARDPVRQFQKFAEKFLLHPPKMLHVDRRLPPTQRAQQGDCSGTHKLTNWDTWFDSKKK